MRRKIGFLVGLVGLVLLVVLLVRTLGNRTPKQGELRVDSTPAVAIYLDDKQIGRTPFKEKVNTGDYTIRLASDTGAGQVASWQGRITVGPNLLTYVNANLNESELSSAVDVLWLEKISSSKSELSVTTNPDGATVLVDDVTKGVTPLSLQDITPGDHTVTVTSVGFLTRSLKVKTTPGYKLIATYKLALSPGGSPEASPSPTPAETPTGTPTGTPKVTPTPTKKPDALTPDPAKPYVVIKDTPTGFLRVRVEPSTSASEAARVNPGEKYHIEDTKSGWYEIKYDGKNAGWISGTYTEKVE